jgi:hypothetical protein
MGHSTSCVIAKARSQRPHRDALELVFLLRNSVHGEGLSSVAVIEDPDRLDVVDHQLLLPPEDNNSNTSLGALPPSSGT